MPKKKIYTEYEAAFVTGMSPDLLRWLTKYPPKFGTKRKLKVSKIEEDIYYFEQDELQEFNSWLKFPWPSKSGKRPNVPREIRREVKKEANGECAICHSHKDTCEAAHLDPVHKSRNNHPENLLWLCSNHHTAYDGGLFGPDEENAEFVVSFKNTLTHFKRTLWGNQHKISQSLLSVLEVCDKLTKQLQMAKTPEQLNAIEKIAKQTLYKLPVLAPVSKSDPKYGAYKSITDNIISLEKDIQPLTLRLQKAQSIRDEYIAAYGFIACPLCKGEGKLDETDCPICNGDRELEKHVAERIDVSAYDKIDCPLCNGGGHFNGNDCPSCGGDSQMYRKYAEIIDIADYQKVTCPLCNQLGRYEGSDCPECGGEGVMESRYADLVDLDQYKKVDCPLCEGVGRHEEYDCPECDGEGVMEKKYADRVDLDQYAKVNCPLCKGKGNRNGNDCPACGGEAHMDRYAADRIDIRDYEMVKCPVCKGKGQHQGGDCLTCGLEGEMERRYLDKI